MELLGEIAVAIFLAQLVLIGYVAKKRLSKKRPKLQIVKNITVKRKKKLAKGKKK